MRRSIFWVFSVVETIHAMAEANGVTVAEAAERYLRPMIDKARAEGNDALAVERERALGLVSDVAGKLRAWCQEAPPPDVVPS